MSDTTFPLEIYVKDREPGAIDARATCTYHYHHVTGPYWSAEVKGWFWNSAIGKHQFTGSPHESIHFMVPPLFVLGELRIPRALAPAC